MGYKNVLVPLDGSSFAKKSLDEAVKVAQDDHARVILLGIVEVPPAAFEGYTEFAVNLEANDQLKEQLTASIEESAAELRQKGVNAEVIIRTGFPVDEIEKAALEQSVDLIVMTTHGRRGFAHFLLGSVAEKIVRMAPCSVLVVRPGAGDE